jgi:hypothetical protein
VSDWDASREAALAELELLRSLIQEEGAEDRIIEGYLQAREVLSRSFRTLMLQGLTSKLSLLSETRQEIERCMSQLFAGLIPLKYLVIRGRSSPHAEILAYLALRVEKPVRADELRILTGDAIHTERRTRELRDLGFGIVARHTAGADTYTLSSITPDYRWAAVHQVRKKIAGAGDLSREMKDELLRVVDLVVSNEANELPARGDKSP